MLTIHTEILAMKTPELSEALLVFCTKIIVDPFPVQAPCRYQQRRHLLSFPLIFASDPCRFMHTCCRDHARFDSKLLIMDDVVNRSSDPGCQLALLFRSVQACF